MYILSVTGHLELDVLIQQNSMNQGGWKKNRKNIFFMSYGFRPFKKLVGFEQKSKEIVISTVRCNFCKPSSK